MNQATQRPELVLAGICIYSPDANEIEEAIRHSIPSENEDVVGECIRGIGHLAWRFRSVDSELFNLVFLRAKELSHLPYIRDIWREIEGDVKTFVPTLKFPNMD